MIQIHEKVSNLKKSYEEDWFIVDIRRTLFGEMFVRNLFFFSRKKQLSNLNHQQFEINFELLWYEESSFLV